MGPLVKRFALAKLPDPPKETLHTSWDGAVVVAGSAVSGLKALPADPLGKFFAPLASKIAPASRTP